MHNYLHKNPHKITRWSVFVGGYCQIIWLVVEKPQVLPESELAGTMPGIFSFIMYICALHNWPLTVFYLSFWLQARFTQTVL